MTRQQAIREYRSFYGNPKQWKYAVQHDRTAVRCGFVDYVDTLQKSGRITEEQADKWDGILKDRHFGKHPAGAGGRDGKAVSDGTLGDQPVGPR